MQSEHKAAKLLLMAHEPTLPVSLRAASPIPQARPKKAAIGKTAQNTMAGVWPSRLPSKCGKMKLENTAAQRNPETAHATETVVLIRLLGRTGRNGTTYRQPHATRRVKATAAKATD